MKSKITESKIEKRFVAYCRTHGLLTYKFSSPAHRGVPDRVVMAGGKVMFLELKRPGNTPTALQLHEIARINAAGVHATWADSYDRAVAAVNGYFTDLPRWVAVQKVFDRAYGKARKLI